MRYYYMIKHINWKLTLRCSFFFQGQDKTPRDNTAKCFLSLGVHKDEEDWFIFHLHKCNK